MPTDATTLELPLVPKSFNSTRYAPWYVARAANEELKQAIGFSLMAVGGERNRRAVRASALLIFPQRRRRDEGNFRTPLEKALGDALVEGRWIEDDTPDQYRFGALTFSNEKGPSQTIITLIWSD